MNKNLLITILVAVVAAGAGFGGGMKYAQSRRTTAGAGRFGANGGPGPSSRTAGGQFGANRGGFRPVYGEITEADDKSATVKVADGSSKIVILADSTKINKASEGDKSDLKKGETVAVFGTENSDGSVTAQNIQLNPQTERFGPASTP